MTWDGDGGLTPSPEAQGLTPICSASASATATSPSPTQCGVQHHPDEVGITYDQLFAWNNAGALIMGIRGQAGQITVNSDFVAGNNVIKTLDMNGASQVDLSTITGGNNLTDNADTFTGSATTVVTALLANLLFNLKLN